MTACHSSPVRNDYTVHQRQLPAKRIIYTHKLNTVHSIRKKKMFGCLKRELFVDKEILRNNIRSLFTIDDQIG